MESNSVCNHTSDLQIRGSPIWLIKGMIADRIGRHEVLLPITDNFNKIGDV